LAWMTIEEPFGPRRDAVTPTSRVAFKSV
jgi:hypothetical protein